MALWFEGASACKLIESGFVAWFMMGLIASHHRCNWFEWRVGIVSWLRRPHLQLHKPLSISFMKYFLITHLSSASTYKSVWFSKQFTSVFQFLIVQSNLPLQPSCSLQSSFPLRLPHLLLQLPQTSTREQVPPTRKMKKSPPRFEHCLFADQRCRQ